MGYRSGFFPELFRIVSYLLTFFIAFTFKQELADLITLNSFLNQSAAEWIAFTALLVVMFFTTKLISMIFLKAFKTADGALLVRLLGMCLGVVRWMVLLSLIFLLINQSPLDGLKTDIHERSVLGPRIAALAPTMVEFLSSLSPQLAIKPTV